MEKYRQASPHNCEHTSYELRDYPTSNGGWQRKPQCLICGQAVGKPEKREKSISVPHWDMERRATWEGECRLRQEEIETTLISRTASLEAGGYDCYEEYLRSSEWKERRELVIKRDGGLCQACLSEQATEVHHLTYDQIFKEYLFDLVAVCRNCHERLHNKKIAAKEAARAKGLF
jgi:5-methylcytosine-specific restriction endonuclease McrA